jgi:hypothetical protein
MRGRITAACIRVLLATIEATRKKSTSLFHVVAQLVIVRLIICMLYKGKVSTTALQALSARPLLRSFELPSLTNFKCCCCFFLHEMDTTRRKPVCVCVLNRKFVGPYCCCLIEGSLTHYEVQWYGKRHGWATRGDWPRIHRHKNYK